MRGLPSDPIVVVERGQQRTDRFTAAAPGQRHGDLTSHVGRFVGQPIDQSALSRVGPKKPQRLGRPSTNRGFFGTKPRQLLGQLALIRPVLAPGVRGMFRNPQLRNGHVAPERHGGNQDQESHHRSVSGVMVPQAPQTMGPSFR